MLEALLLAMVVDRPRLRVPEGNEETTQSIIVSVPLVNVEAAAVSRREADILLAIKLASFRRRAAASGIWSSAVMVSFAPPGRLSPWVRLTGAGRPARRQQTTGSRNGAGGHAPAGRTSCASRASPRASDRLRRGSQRSAGHSGHWIGRHQPELNVVRRIAEPAAAVGL